MSAVATLERCGNQFCPGHLRENTGYIDDYGHGEPHCDTCGKTKAQGKAKAEEVRQSRQHIEQKRMDEENRRRHNEEVAKEIKKEEEQNMVVKESEQAASQVKPRVNKGSSKAEFIDANRVQIAADIEALGLYKTASKWGLSEPTLRKYFGSLAVKTRRKVKAETKLAEMPIVAEQARKEEPVVLEAKTPVADTQAAQPETAPPPSGKVTIIGIRVPGSLPPLPQFKWWWLPSVQRAWLETYAKLAELRK